ncbi:MAG: S8 family serine peptidase [Candidatus Hermodarchaeota archaeon]
MRRQTKKGMIQKPRYHVLLLATVLLLIPLIQADLESVNLTNTFLENDEAESKLSKPLHELIQSGSDPDLPIDIIASLSESIDWRAAQRAILQKAALTNIKIYHSIVHAISLRTTVGALHQLVGLPEIRKLWTDIGFHLDTSDHSIHQGQMVVPNGYLHPGEIIGVNPLYSQGFNGSHTVVSIIDTGVDVTHPDLDDMDDNETTNDPKVLAQVSFAEGDPFPFDLNGHGTYCAGLVAGTGAASQGNYTGIAPGAHLISAKVVLGDGTSYSSWVIRGIEWSITTGADIILLPFSTLGMPGDPLSEAVRTASELGVLVVAAAGDRGPNHMTIMSPGESLAALTVGAFDHEANSVPDFSSRGPTFDMRTKPDLIAPGIDIISSSLYNILPTDIGNVSISPEDIDFEKFGVGQFGTVINENYTIASTTAASAALTAGTACLLLQGSRYATPECMSIAMRKGANPQVNEPNIEGAGLLDAATAHIELDSLFDPFPSSFRARSVGLGLPYYGILVSESSSENVTLLMSGYTTAIAAIASSSVTNMSMFHMLMGMFYLAVENSSVLPFAFLNVEQEFHWTGLPYGNYVRATGILSYNDLLIIPRIESWQITTPPAANAFRISFFLVNIGTENVTNIRLYSLWNFDLFSGANETSTQQGFFNSSSQLFYVHADTLPPNETTRVDQYIGVNASTPFSSFEVGPYSDVSDRLQNETLNGNSIYDSDDGLGFGTQWQLGDLPAGTSFLRTSMTLGFGRNFSALLHGINETEYSTIPTTLTDLCMIRVSTPRTGTTDATYQTSVIVLNIGDEGVDSIAAFFTNQSQPLGGAIFARYFQLGIFEPFQFQRLLVDWVPEATDIYFAGWIVSPTLDFDLILPTIPTDLYPLDNFVFRDVFINTPPTMRILIPSFLPYSPMTLQFPNDYAIYNFTLLTSTPISHLSVSITEYHNPALHTPLDRNITNWTNPPTITPTDIYDVTIGTQFQILCFIPTFIESGPYYGNLVISASDGWEYILPFVINVTYPHGVILFDSIHNQGLDFSNLEDLDFSDLDLDELFSLLDEIGDSLLTGYSRLRELFAEAQLNLAEIPLISELNSTTLALFDGLIICDPEKGFTQNETLAVSEFIDDGYKVLILADHPNSSNHTTLNQILANYSIQIGGSVTSLNTTELHPSTPFTTEVNIISTEEGTLLNETGSSEIFAWVNGSAFGVYQNESQKELFVLGCSSIFSNRLLLNLENLQFANQTIHYLFRNTMSLTIRPTGGNGSTFTIGNDAGFVIDAVDHTGQGVENLTMYCVYTFPNGTQQFFIAFEVIDGRYGTFLFANWTGLDESVNTTQTFSIIVFSLPGTYASTTTFMYFYYEPAPETPVPPPEPNYLFIMTLQIALFTILAIMIVGGYFLNQYRRRRRMRTPPLDEFMIENIDNTLNTTHALIREMEWTLTDRRLDRIEKLRITSGEPANRLEDMLKRLRELAKETGV